MTRPLRIILFVTFVDLIGFGLIIPLLPVYAKRLDASGLTLGFLVGSFSLMQLLFCPILGRWSDRIGRRGVLLISLGGSVVSHVLLGVADISISLPLLFLARIMDGITGANIATAQAYIADVTTTKDRAKGMGLFGAAFGLGFVVGPGIGAGLAALGGAVVGERYGTSFPAFGAALFSLVAMILVWRWLPESRAVNKAQRAGMAVLKWSAMRDALGHDRLRELLTFAFTTVFAFVLLEVSFVYLCKDALGLDMVGVGMIFAFIGILMVIVQGGLVGRLAHRVGETRLITWGPFVTAVGFALLAMVSTTSDSTLIWLLILSSCAPVAFGTGITNPSLHALLSRQASRDDQGSTLGVAQGVGSTARCIAPPIGGLLYDLGASIPYLCGAAIFCVAGFYAWRIGSRQVLAVRSMDGEREEHHATVSASE